MKETRTGRAMVLFLAVALGAAAPCLGSDPGKDAETLWNAREDLQKAKEAVSAYEGLLAQSPGSHEFLLRLSRLHYWIGQNLESTDEKAALDHYGKGREYGKRASETGPDRPGGYFFEAANLARENSLRGKLSNLMGVSVVRGLNEKTASLDPGYFYRGPDRFFCAMYTKLPSILGGSTKEAIAHGKRAVEAFPDYAGNRLYLAEAYAKDGRNDLARRELEAAAALPDDALPDVVPEQRLEKKRAAALLTRIGK